MRTENGKIVEITENELYSLWLKRGMDDIMSFTDYMFRFEELGTKIIRGKWETITNYYNERRK